MSGGADFLVELRGLEPQCPCLSLSALGAMCDGRLDAAVMARRSSLSHSFCRSSSLLQTKIHLAGCY
jgi:hypothetical protein